MNSLQNSLSYLKFCIGSSRYLNCFPHVPQCHRWKTVTYVCFSIVLIWMLAFGPIYSTLNRKYICMPRKKIEKRPLCPVSSILRTRSNIASLEQLKSCPLVFYNRVPKCASRTVLHVFKTLACQNGFQFVTEPKTHKEYFVEIEEMISLAQRVIYQEEFKVFSRHVYFINFKRLNLPEPMYINVIRDPLERAISHYYYNRHGSNSAPRSSVNSRFNQTLDECIQRGRGACFNMDRMLPYFCGHHSVCRKNKSIALKRAMRTVREQYVLVGLTEDLPAFMKAISTLMPQFFKNATQVYNSLSDELWNKYSTVKKVEIKEETTQKLREILKYEYEFYKFVKQRFYNIYSKLNRYRERTFLNIILGSDTVKTTEAEKVLS